MGTNGAEFNIDFIIKTITVSFIPIYMRGVPIGNDDFKDIRENDLYYVDKTGLIEEIVSDRNIKVFLFTRPRRFGKTLNMSMVDAFFNLEYKGNSWFNGLRVLSSPECVGMMNQNPVITISLKNLNKSHYDKFLADYREKIRRVSRQYEYLLNEKSGISDIVGRMISGDMSEASMKTSLLDLSEALYRHHGKKVIVLIDEYDDAINGSYGNEANEDILEFIRDLLGNTLKGNGCLRFGVVTGVMQIAKESIFSGLNNLHVNNIFDPQYDERFGFTESEVMDMLSYYGHPEKLAEVREWYDGYRFGNAEIYNPWSILQYIQADFRIDSYWLNEGNPAVIFESIGMNGPKALEVITDLYNEGTIDAGLNKEMIFTDLSSMDGLFSLLTASGYLKAVHLDDDRWRLSLVNKEVRKGLLNQLATGRWRPIYMNRISEAILSGSPDDVRVELMESLDCTVDSKLTRNEKYYQAFTLGLLNCLTSSYYVRSEYSGGRGYADIALIPRDGKGPFAVIELKDEDADVSDEKMQNVAEEALEQIGALRYYADLHGEIHTYGIATRQTDVFIAYRKVVR